MHNAQTLTPAEAARIAAALADAPLSTLAAMAPMLDAVPVAGGGWRAPRIAKGRRVL